MNRSPCWGSIFIRRINRMKNWTFMLVLVLIIHGFLVTPARADCGDIARQSEAAIKQQDIARLRQLNRDAEKDNAFCTDDFKQWLGQQTAIVMIRRTRGLILAGNNNQAIQLLEDSLVYHRDWMALAMLADAHTDRKEYAQASRKYQEALNVINDPELTPRQPSTGFIAKVFKKAEQSRLLADVYVASPRSRDGSPGGLSIVGVRGFTVEKVAIPVTFQYNSTEYTSQGREAAAALLADLVEQGVTSTILIGHTDPRGTREYNQDLSLRRAGRLSLYLSNNGFTGQIRVEGRGEDEPYQPLDAAGLTQEELYRICRRVEVVQQ